jgi:NAD(P)-dependent dehydrogenase (short-subunit alcohol dehydrogenase family)
MPRTILITGASSGIGLATALSFQQEGWNVVASMRDPARDTQLAALPNVLVPRLDVQDDASITSAVDQALNRFGRIDVLLNNAGYGAYGPLEATSDATMQRQYDVNVFGVMRTTRAVLPHFRRQRGGVVINVASMGGRFAFPLGTLYHGTKFAVEGLSEALQYELAPLGVRVKIIEPGAIRTEFAGRSFDFVNDVTMTEYQPLIQRFMEVLGPVMASAQLPTAVADTIFAAATDDSARLRYICGADAEQIIAARRQLDDETFAETIRTQFGVTLA